jgi:hypothetical protein
MWKSPLELESKSHFSYPFNRVVHLTIREGDDIQKIIRGFCKSYALNEATRRKLDMEINDYLSQ